VNRPLAPVIGLIAVLAPAAAQAQTNIDQGKTPAQMFATDCAECHKAARGLANGKNSATLTDFLHEHYTTSREQAAALAAYVLTGRSGEPGGAQGQGQKLAPEHASASTEEPKPAKHEPAHSAKPEEGKPATAKLHRPGETPAKPNNGASPGETPSMMAPVPRSATASRGHHKEQKTPAPVQEPAAVAHVPAAAVTEPVPSEAPSQEASPPPAATAPTDAPSGDSGESGPVERDHVPD
jgi:cytochrome c553